MTETPLNILRKYWGFDAFRPLQEDIIQSVLDGNDTLALLPTGGGKSLCFQVPALCREGVCIVISPLIALMKDQVHNLVRRNIPAAAIFSGMHYRDIDRILDNCVFGGIKLLYLSPERLTTDLAKERIKRMNVNLIAVDEAHCVSQWGYDFRPPYLKIKELREILPQTAVLAVTATATQEVVLDIQEKLDFKRPKIFQRSFVRENLAYVVLSEENKLDKLNDIVQKVKGSGVVYVRNRKLTKEVARFLLQNQVSADFYHAGLTPEQRAARQDAWVAGKTRIMVCTNAFGMGIDKPDVRTVVHLDLPDSLEAYFQEAGRAGRDGKKAYAVLLFSNQDKAALEKNFESSYPDLKDIRQVYQALGSYYQVATGGGAGQSFDFDIVDFCNNFKLEPLKTFSCLKSLEQEGWIALSEAVWLPSSFTILLSREKLYDFQLKNPKFDLIVKTLLRTSEGAFLHQVKVQENTLAKFLKIETPVFVAALQQLHKEGIIDYRPAKDQPQLTFAKERVDAANLSLDMKMYNFRKERQRARIEKSIEYATTTVCRSVQLLRYFGENAEPCGSCDVCLGRTQADLSTEEFERYKLKISMLLKNEALTEKQLADSFAANKREMVLRALAFLLDEGLVVKQEGKLTWNP